MIYESTTLLNQYLLFHYGSAEDIFGGTTYGISESELVEFPVRTVRETFDFIDAPFPNALDLGCAVGRSAFELSKHCEEVVAIDYSQAFIDAADKIKAGLPVPYERLEEAAIATSLEARLPAGCHPERVTFLRGDAMNLPEDTPSFDLVHAANLLCRLPDPGRLLKRLPKLVKPGGQLVLATPCTWLEEFTPRENWPPEDTLGFISKHLSPRFELFNRHDFTFFLREHARKFQFTTSLVTVWHRKR